MALEGLTTLDLTDVDDATLQRFHEDLMTPMFPPAELMTYEELRRARQEGSTSGTLLLGHDGPVGGIVTELYLDGRVLLVAYLVVASAMRSRGLGSELLATVAAPGPLVLAEIDDPRRHPVGPYGDPYRRVRFYEREGWRLLPLSYTQPSLRPGSPRVGGLLLITSWATDADVDGVLVAEFLEEYFSVCEDATTLADDPEYQSLRRAASGAGNGRLTLHPLSDLDAARPLDP
jgi:GNAT superfamily N-acetyltransferase